MVWFRFAPGVVALTLLAACSPGLDWREVRSASGHVVNLFPCKPKAQTRSLPIESTAWAATLQVCDAQGMTFAVLSLVPESGRAADPAAIPASPSPLEALMSSAVQRWGPVSTDASAWTAVGLDASLKPHWQHHSRADAQGRMVLTQALFLQHEGHLLQLSVSGSALPPAALEPFFESVRPAR